MASVSTTHRLSTGHEVSLPLELEFATGGVVVPARRGRLEATLPAGLSSVAIGPGVGCVSLVGIQYRRVGGSTGEETDGGGEGGGDELEPYNEFAAIIPAVRGGRTTIPLAQLFDADLGGFVHWLPVTTEASVALGRELWGYPKERAEITVTDGPRGVRTVVGSDPEPAVRLDVPRPRLAFGLGSRGGSTAHGGPERNWTLTSFTTKHGDLHRTRAEIEGRVAVGPAVGATLEVGSGAGAAILRRLGTWNRPLVAFAGSRVRAQLSAPEAVPSAAPSANGR
ncbi:acetoacetate decarboxylase family protein [Natrialbaceae archaeon GCM10025810]|uniref:acetoacetate decarboxylase family protein n=1 Tax=Halovalidus salilacus TaxID=3075124 RepID=UPI003609721B